MSTRASQPAHASHAPIAPGAAATLARFCADLDLRSVPEDVIASARACITDTVGVAVFGSRFPWSQAIARFALAYGSGARCRLLGIGGAGVHAPYAALANGAFAHAFEQDSLRKPGAGVHPGAALVPPALSLAEERAASGERVLLAFIAGCEAMFRIGDASLHSSERLGFHAPGLTGPYGAAIAAGMVMGLGAGQLADAIGIAGSLSAGLLAFSRAGRGGEVKRLHLGRACESGVVAARLAAEGFGGPETVLDGQFGFLQAYCAQSDPTRLTAGLGTIWETRRICLKAYPCHVTAHTPIESLRALMAEHRFVAADVAALEVQASDKVLSHHDLRAPRDIMQAQYSVPFCVALALHRDPSDPGAFDPSALDDPAIAATCAAIQLQAFADAASHSSWASRVDITLRDGRKFSREAESFAGAPERPLDRAALRERFARLTAGTDPSASAAWFDALQRVEAIRDFSQLPGLVVRR